MGKGCKGFGIGLSPLDRWQMSQDLTNCFTDFASFGSRNNGVSEGKFARDQDDKMMHFDDTCEAALI